MKSYVGTLYNIPQSISSARRCIESARRFNVIVELFPAVYKDIAIREANNEKLKIGSWNETYSNSDAVIGNFITQYRIWKKILSNNGPGIVLEHDAVFINYIPKLNGDIINLGKPSYGKFNKKDKPGEYPIFSKSRGYIPGAHGYYITPKGASQLIKKAKDIGILPCDLFINKKYFPNITEYYPWPIEAHDSFTTIQKKKGCLAKHNFNKDFEIL